MAEKKHDYFEDTQPTTFKVDRKQGYAKRTGKGFRGAYWNSHHVLPCTSLKTSLNEYLKGKEPHYKQVLGRFTNWDVNQGYNLLGMANEAAYLAAYGDPMLATVVAKKPTWMKAMKNIPAVAPHGPIHLPVSWGHPKYNGNVKKKLDVIWDDCEAELDEHKKPKGNDLQAAIQAISNTFCAQLQGKTGQTKERWEDPNPAVRDQYFRMA